MKKSLVVPTQPHSTWPLSPRILSYLSLKEIEAIERGTDRSLVAVNVKSSLILNTSKSNLRLKKWWRTVSMGSQLICDRQMNG
ncbi:hypothetical protein Q3G72_003491 [Acer saccharum]|nr:hypothetical protein Q3G72_003491 [Acer saccharum]